MLESSDTVLRDISGVLGYYSYGSNDPPSRRGISPRFRARRAGRDVREQRRANLCGAAGALGDRHVAEQRVILRRQPAIARRRPDPSRNHGVAGMSPSPTWRPQSGRKYCSCLPGGFNLAESFYLAMPNLSWQTTVWATALRSVPSGDACPRHKSTRNRSGNGTAGLFSAGACASLRWRPTSRCAFSGGYQAHAQVGSASGKRRP